MGLVNNIYLKCFCAVLALSLPSASISSPLTSLNISTQNIYITKICDAVVAEALATINIKANFVHLPTARAGKMSNQGKTDAEACRVKGFNKKYSNLIRIDPSILPLEGNAFVKDLDLKIEENNWDALRAYKLGIHNGHYYSTQATKGFSKVISINSDLQLLKMLNLKRLDVAVMIAPDALYDIKQANLQDSVKIVQPPISKFPLHFYIHKNNENLAPDLTKAIEKIVESGRAMQIYHEFLDKL